MKKMKATQKMALLPILILFSAAVFVYAQEVGQAEPPAAPSPESPDRPRFMLSDDYIADLLEKIKQNDPNEAARLEKLQQEDPRQFRLEIRRITWEQMKSERQSRLERPVLPEGPEGSDAMRNTRNPGRIFNARDRAREQLGEMEQELISWLEKNEPDKAKELAELKENNPLAYMKIIAIETKKYREIIEAEKTNPALAEILKKDLALKQQRDQLLEKIRGATDEKEKQQLAEQLKQVVSERFDLIVQKKQFKYEDLKKKLEELQQRVNRSQTELENFKNKKEEHIKTYIEKLISQAEQFDWD
jgi:hypothetical protein